MIVVVHTFANLLLYGRHMSSCGTLVIGTAVAMFNCAISAPMFLG